jgi:hypothetical protein
LRIVDSNSRNAVSFFIRAHNETLCVVAVRVNNPDRSPVGINRWDVTVAPTALLEIIGVYFPVLHASIATLPWLEHIWQGLWLNKPNELKARQIVAGSSGNFADSLAVFCGSLPYRTKVLYATVGNAAKKVLDYVTRRFNASSAGL